MRKITLPKLLRATAVLILLVGGCIGYDMGDRIVTVDQVMFSSFDFITALVAWFFTAAVFLLFWSVARIVERLDSLQ